MLNPLRYRGYVYDSETELYYLQSRYYDPEMGRFLNADGLTTTGQGFIGRNMFAYCGNCPVGRMDYGGTRYCEATTVKDESAKNRSISCRYQREVALSPPSDYIDVDSNSQNCYSYAFGLPFLANPGDYSALSDSDYLFADKRIYTPEEIAEYVMRDMSTLKKIVRIVDSPADKLDNEYIVAMKTSTIILAEIGVADYHFAVQLSDGSWADKPGTTPSRWNALDGTAAAWDLGGIKGYYNTKTVYFAVRR